MAKATLANLPSSLRAHSSSEVHLFTAASRSKGCLYRLCLPCKVLQMLQGARGLEDMPAKRTVALEVVSFILSVATLLTAVLIGGPKAQ